MCVYSIDAVDTHINGVSKSDHQAKLLNLRSQHSTVNIPGIIVAVNPSLRAALEKSQNNFFFIYHAFSNFPIIFMKFINMFSTGTISASYSFDALIALTCPFFDAKNIAVNSILFCTETSAPASFNALIALTCLHSAAICIGLHSFIDRAEISAPTSFNTLIALKCPFLPPHALVSIPFSPVPRH